MYLKFITWIGLVLCMSGLPWQERHEVVTDKKASWSDLQFNREKNNQITKLEFSIWVSGDNQWQRNIHIDRTKVVESFEIADPRILAYVESAIYQPLMIAGDQESRWLGPWSKIGTCRVTTAKNNTLELGISNFGFVLGGNEPEVSNLFYSWALARVLADEYQRKNKTLHVKNFNRLSGVAYALADERFYRKMLEQSKGQNKGQTKQNGQEP